MLKLPRLVSQKRIKNLLLFLSMFVLILLFLFSRFFLDNKPKNWQFITGNEIIFDPDFGMMPLGFDKENIYFANLDGYIFAFNKRTGKEKWHYRTNEYPRHGLNTSSELFVYAADFDGRIYAFDKKTGKEKWRFVTPGLFKVDTPPFISEDLLYFGSRNGILYALDRFSGEKKWEFKTRGIDNSQLVVDEIIIHFGQFSLDENNVYINSATDETIYALNKRTGEEEWRFKSHQYMFGMPVVGKKIVVFSSKGGFLYGLDKYSGQLRWRQWVGQHDNKKIEDDIVYYKNGKGNLYTLDSQTGKEKWNYSKKEFVVNGGKIYLVTSTFENSGQLIILDRQTGEINWQFNSPGTINYPPQINNGMIYLGSGGNLYALDAQDGQEQWQFIALGMVEYISVISEGIYLLNDVGGGRVLIHFIDKKTGEKKWHFLIDDIDLTTTIENEGNLYFLTKDHHGFFVLKKNQAKERVELVKIEKINELDKSKLNLSIGQKTLKLIKALSVDSEKKQIEVISETDKLDTYDIYELIINHDDSFYNNVWEEVDVLVTFTHEDGVGYFVKGFYYDKDIWKVRFSPPAIGKWSWKLTFKTPITKKTSEGSFVARKSNALGFVRIHSTNPYRLVFENEELFNAIGLQDCVLDKNHNGDPLDQWSIGKKEKPDKDPKVIRYSDLETYLRSYGPSGAGFNLFRWNIDNCSYKLWRDIVPGNNFYDINQGIRGDELLKSLKENNFRIWMTIFGFKLPLINTISEEDSYTGLKFSKKETEKAIKSYLDYVVARYSSYVDIWELANEANTDEDWVKLMAEYLRSVDPYNHLVTVSWERPDLLPIEINSVHWYERESELISDLLVVNKITEAKKWKKPVVFSEHGNRKSNWDGTSALRMRIHTWTAFFKEAVLIFWNTSGKLFQHDTKSTNIYLGPKERQYLRILQDFTREIDGDIKQEAIDFKNKEIRVYGLKSDSYFLAYLYNGKSRNQLVDTSVTINLSKSGFFEWINPENGQVLGGGRIDSGTQSLTTPWFKIDLALKIRFDD